MCSCDTSETLNVNYQGLIPPASVSLLPGWIIELAEEGTHTQKRQILLIWSTSRIITAAQDEYKMRINVWLFPGDSLGITPPLTPTFAAGPLHQRLVLFFFLSVFFFAALHCSSIFLRMWCVYRLLFCRLFNQTVGWLVSFCWWWQRRWWRRPVHIVFGWVGDAGKAKKKRRSTEWANVCLHMGRCFYHWCCCCC